MYDRRPSDRELNKRLNEAKELLKNRYGIFANPSKAVGELSNLDIGDANDVWSLIRELLEEISPKDYRGLSYWLLAGGSLNVLSKCISNLF